MHVIRSDPGRLSVSYRARIRARAVGPPEGRDQRAASATVDGQLSELERQVYLRPSRYCPATISPALPWRKFGAGPSVAARVAGITEWIRSRIAYVPGSSTVHDSAEDTLLTGAGTCRDFAHLGVALCRATGVPARFSAVYAPGLSPMEFHAVFEALVDGRWYVHDPTGLAPRPSLVRVTTGRDAADAAFAAVTTGIANLESIEVSAISEPSLPVDDHVRKVVLA